MQRVIMKSELHSATLTRAIGFQGSRGTARMYEHELRDCTLPALRFHAHNDVVEQAAVA
jgi:hypothetical protein